MGELQSQDLEDLLQELGAGDGAGELLAPEVETRVRVCPECGKQNLEDAWHCIDCGTTLSLRTLRKVEEGQVAGLSSVSPSFEQDVAELLHTTLQDGESVVYGGSAKDELRPEDVEGLVQEVEEEDSTQESPAPDVEELLHALQSGSVAPDRRDAAEQLGSVETSSSQIVRALKQAQETDPHPEVRRAAERSLRAPVHVEFVAQHPDVVEAAATDRQQPTNSAGARPRPEEGGKKAFVSGLFQDRRWRRAALYLLVLFTATSLAFGVSDAWPVLVAAGVWFAGAVLGLIVLRQKGYRVLGILGALLDLLGSVGSLAGLRGDCSGER